MKQQETKQQTKQLTSHNSVDVESLAQIIQAQQRQLDVYQRLLQRKTKTNFKAAIAGSFKITSKEILEMPTTNKDKNMFAVRDMIIRYRQLPSGAYQARMKRKGIELDVRAYSPKELKENFIRALDEALTQQALDDAMVTPDNSPTFMEYAYKWLAIKKRTTKPSTYKEYDRQVDHTLFLRFADRKATSFTRDELQQYLFEYVDRGKLHTAHKYHLTLTCIFDLIEDDLGFPSPMKKVVVPRFTSKHGKALTYEEERVLVDYCIKHLYCDACHAYLVLLYTGMRRSELARLEVVDDNWIRTVTSKQLMGKNEETRYIPVTPMLRRVLPYIDWERAKNCKPNSVTNKLKQILPEHHTHELRYTFITRCKEAGVNLELVMLWDGHCQDVFCGSSVVDRGYTDYSKSFQLKQSLLVDYQQWDFPEANYVAPNPAERFWSKKCKATQTN
ncbi:MAG: site-specific integrase [Corallococcus sp.]|nr:site-specific integrase [Corallococcus sp.]